MQGLGKMYTSKSRPQMSEKGLFPLAYLFMYTIQFLSYVSANLRTGLHIYFNYGTAT